VVGLPPKPARLMAGLLYLKHTFALSDEELTHKALQKPVLHGDNGRC
jgi:hypothetical protein